MTDTQILNWLRKNLEWDGYGYWLPEFCIKERGWGEENCAEPTMKEFRAALEARAKEPK